MPPVTSAAMPWIVANRTRPTRSGSPGSSAALGLALLDQLEQDRERALGALVQRAGLLAVLAREHQLQQRGVACREADIGGGARLQARLEGVARALDRASQLGPEAREPGLGERVEQRLAIGEVAPRRAVADAGLARELAQRQRLRAALAHGPLGLLEQRRAEVAVVVGARAHPARSLAEEVVIDIIVVSAYYVAYDYLEHHRHP
jgi:hypothetical protein